MSNSGENYEDAKERKRKKMRQESLKQLLQRIGKEDTPLNVAIIGTPGSGKSAFINTFIASITGEWRSYAMAGSFGGLGAQKTKHFAIYRKEKYLKHAKHLMKFNFPTIIDLSGISDANDKESRILLDLVFSGRVPEDSKIHDVLDDIRNNEERLQILYPVAESNIRVDRIIFVISASNETLPENLMLAVRSTNTLEQREIPVFGVVTKIDDPFTSEQSELKDFFKRIRTNLGVLDIHLLQCTNYCDVNLKEIKAGIRHNLPEIDTDVLQGMKQILDPSLPAPTYNRSSARLMDISSLLVFGFVCLVITILQMYFWKLF